MIHAMQSDEALSKAPYFYQAHTNFLSLSPRQMLRLEPSRPYAMLPLLLRALHLRGDSLERLSLALKQAL